MKSTNTSHPTSRSSRASIRSDQPMCSPQFAETLSRLVATENPQQVLSYSESKFLLHDVRAATGIVLATMGGGTSQRVDEVCSEFFLRILEGRILTRYIASKGVLAQFLYGVLRIIALEVLRREHGAPQTWHRQTLEEDALQSAAEQYLPEFYRDVISESLEFLSENQRLALEMSLRDMPSAEPSKAMRRRQALHRHRAIKAIRKRLR